jgi:hypothetical protein
MGLTSRFSRTWLLATSLAVAVWCGCAYRQNGSSGGYFNSYLNQTPPELAAGGEWINTEEPLSLAGLRGRVVWLEFSFLN